MTDRSTEMESGHREPGIIVSAKEEPPPRVHGTPGRRWDLARLGPAVRTSEPRAESFLGPAGMPLVASRPFLALALSENAWGPRPTKRVRIRA